MDVKITLCTNIASLKFEKFIYKPLKTYSNVHFFIFVEIEEVKVYSTDIPFYSKVLDRKTHYSICPIVLYCKVSSELVGFRYDNKLACNLYPRQIHLARTFLLSPRNRFQQNGDPRTHSGRY